jgi:hypothetical protein
VTNTETLSAATESLRAQVESFYARQMQLLDASRTAEWADTFTEDGVFATNVRPEAAVGRSVIASAATKARADLAAAGLMHRHWLGMLVVDPRDDGTVAATSYALVVETPRGGAPTLKHSTRCDDVLVSVGGEWLVKHRMISRDDLA